MKYRFITMDDDIDYDNKLIYTDNSIRQNFLFDKLHFIKSKKTIELYLGIEGEII